MSDPKSFYDSFAAYYDLIFEDWEQSMHRQGHFIAGLLQHELPAMPDARVLDAAAGIGTQSLPLARAGFQVFSRDLSNAAIDRLLHEAEARNLVIDAAAADMRDVHATLPQPVDVVLAFDNSVPHLLSDDDILRAFESFFRCLKPGGLCLLSVRDYDATPRTTDFVHAYGVRWRDGVRHIPLQVWRWLDDYHYELTLHIVVESTPQQRLLSFVTHYYAVSVSRLLELLQQAGFIDCRRLDESVYQPVLLARRPKAQ